MMRRLTTSVFQAMRPNAYEMLRESASFYQEEYYFVSFCDNFHDWQ